MAHTALDEACTQEPLSLRNAHTLEDIEGLYTLQSAHLRVDFIYNLAIGGKITIEDARTQIRTILEEL